MQKAGKAAGMEIKEVTQDGTFEGLLTVWDKPDMQDDVVVKGAFRKTLKEKGPTRPLLWQHYAWEPIGVLDAKETDDGLHITGRLNLDVQRAKEAFSLLKQGAVTGLSQGFITRAWKPRKDVAGRMLTEIDLWEGSLATFPAQPDARILAVRSALPPWFLAAEKAAQPIESRLSAITKGVDGILARKVA